MKAVTRRTLLGASAIALLYRQGRGQAASGPAPDFVCPMDPDVHSPVPGKCPRCGMPLEARIVDPRVYPMEIAARPETIPAGRSVELSFRLMDPRTRSTVTQFELVHEKLFHLFAVSEDLEWFLHDHPALGPDGVFRLPVTFPKTGLYALFADLYPKGGSPQWLPRFVYTQGAEMRAGLRAIAAEPHLTTRDGDVTVAVELSPQQPFAGRATNLFFKVTPGDGMELWLGTYAHAFWISSDLADAEHTHPVYPGDLQFQAYFPRPGTYRFWMQFQRKGVLHTVRFDIPVSG
jgi:hypothetical protein